jgi:hypothetical protein
MFSMLRSSLFVRSTVRIYVVAFSLFVFSSSSFSTSPRQSSWQRNEKFTDQMIDFVWWQWEGCGMMMTMTRHANCVGSHQNQGRTQNDEDGVN